MKNCCVILLDNDKNNPTVCDNLGVAMQTVKTSWCNTSAFIEFKRSGHWYEIYLDNLFIGVIVETVIHSNPTHL